MLKYKYNLNNVLVFTVVVTLLTSNPIPNYSRLPPTFLLRVWPPTIAPHTALSTTAPSSQMLVIMATAGTTTNNTRPTAACPGPERGPAGGGPGVGAGTAMGAAHGARWPP